MRSRVIEMYDWTQMDLSEFAAHFAPDEKKITEECNRLANRRASWKDGVQINAGDMATISMESEEKRYQRKNMTLAVGCNLFDSELEQALIGMKVGGTKTVQLDKAGVTIPVTVTVESVKNKTIPKLTDELVRDSGIEGAATLEEYRALLIEQQKADILEKFSYDAEQKVLQAIHNNSEYVIRQEDWHHAVEIQLNRYAAIAEGDGLRLQDMKAADFEGKVPVSSYHELVALVQDSTWGYLEEYLNGCYYAKKDDAQIDTSREEYDAMIEEYASYWKEERAHAEKINTYEEFVLNQYKSYFYQKLHAFIEQKILG